MSDDVIVTMQDIRTARMCSRGPRVFFTKHNLDWTDFLENGIPASKLVATGDAMALIVVEIARGRK